MKRCWAAQVEVLESFDRICRENGLTYYLAYGTLMGAVRHGGYIPWDDDLDVCMLRPEAKKLAALSPDVFVREGLELATPSNDPTLRNLAFRLINTRETKLEENFLQKYHLFPFMAGLDIFPLDYIPKRRDKWETQRTVFASASLLAKLAADPESDPQELMSAYKEVAKLLGVKPVREVSQVEAHLWALTERAAAMYGPRDTDRVANIAMYHNTGRQLFPVEWFGQPEYLTFEGLTVPVPAQTDAVLKEIYGPDYMTPIQSPSVHSYPWYRPWHEQLIRFFDANGIPCPSIYREL
ncbi:MAG: LicD family protein [Lachnospiraceae bacterium]|nr:LicD family protein [Lachnospiraceae bacterium]